MGDRNDSQSCDNRKRKSDSDDARPDLLPTNEYLRDTLIDNDTGCDKPALAKNASDLPRFQHQPLADPWRQIRLLKILPNSSNYRDVVEHEIEDDIQCTLVTYYWVRGFQFTAISYVWGDTARSWPITIDGKTCLVGRNCLYALQQSRCYLGVYSLIWIDAICIDQQDNREKSAQVSIMGDIFKAATLVLACVGEEAGDSRVLVDAMHHFEDVRHQQERSSPDLCVDCFHAEYGIFSGEEFHLAHTLIADMSPERWKLLMNAFSEFCSRPYGKRLWVVQELVLASDIYFLCGLGRISFRSLLLFYKILDDMAYKEGHIHVLAQRMGLDCHQDIIQENPMNIVFDSRKTMFDVQTAFHRLGDLECADPRDRIYGTLRLIDWRPSGPPAPDYSNSNLQLAIDVLSRVGQRLQFDDDVTALVNFLAADNDRGRRNAMSLLNKISNAIEEPRPSSEQQATMCQCQTPVTPQCGMLEERWKYAHVRAGQNGNLYAGITQIGQPLGHIQLESLADGHSERVLYPTIQYQSNTPLRDGDLLVEMNVYPAVDNQVIEDNVYAMANPRFWIIRGAQTGYYKIIGLAMTRIACSICPGGVRCPQQIESLRCPLSPFNEPDERNAGCIWVSIDATDAVLYCLFNTRYTEHYHSAEPEYEGDRSLLFNVPGIEDLMYFCHRPWSSFAFEYIGESLHPGSFQRKPVPRILGVASVDGSKIPCAHCGGLFIPGEALPAFWVTQH